MIHRAEPHDTVHPDCEHLKAWRDPSTGRTWPNHCSLSTEPLEGADYDRAVDLVMTDRGRWLSLTSHDENAGLLSRALATIYEMRLGPKPWPPPSRIDAVLAIGGDADEVREWEAAFRNADGEWQWASGAMVDFELPADHWIKRPADPENF